MTVRILATGNVETLEDSYAQRLLDLGYAVPHAAPEPAIPEPETTETAAPEQGDGSAVPPDGVTDETVPAVPARAQETKQNPRGKKTR